MEAQNISFVIAPDNLRPAVSDQDRLPNMNAGPDFFNAELKMNGTLWVGNVRVHTQASDWLLHRHDRDKAYDTVILHVVGESNCDVYRTNGELVPQMVLTCPDTVRLRYEELRQTEIYPPCYSIIASLPKLTVHSWLSALQVERFEQKACVISQRLERCNHHWEDVFFITLARNFGFGLNGDAFEGMGKPPSIPRRRQASGQSVSSGGFLPGAGRPAGGGLGRGR